MSLFHTNKNHSPYRLLKEVRMLAFLLIVALPIVSDAKYQITLTASPGVLVQTWTVPYDWKSIGNKVECIGAGGDGGPSGTGAQSNRAGTGGGGGAYEKITNFITKPNASISYMVGAHATTTNGNVSNETFFNSTASSTASLSCAFGRIGNGAGNSTAGGLAGITNQGTGASGNNGGVGGTATAVNGSSGGAGGAGSGGPTGVGKNGGAGGAATTNGAGGGGGGSNGGTSSAGSQPGNINTGGAGGNGTSGSGSGAGAIFNGANAVAGTVGGGGGGGQATSTSRAVGAQGGLDTAFNAAIGAGGGGGGGAGTTTAAHGTGGGGATYGGGGGGAGGGNATNLAGSGGQGVIVITYEPNVGQIRIFNGKISIKGGKVYIR